MHAKTTRTDRRRRRSRPETTGGSSAPDHEVGAAFPVLLLGPNHTREERALALEAFRPMLQTA